MSKLLLLVQSEADVQHLDGAAQAILNSAITGVWVVFSPAITVNASEAAAKFDAEIAVLREAYRQSIEREDLDAAKDYKLRRETKELEKSKAIRDSWKTVTGADRGKRVQAVFDPFKAPLLAKGIQVSMSMCNDHFEADQFIQMLNSFSARFKPIQTTDPNLVFTPGKFSINWPEAMAGMMKPFKVQTQIPVEAKPRISEADLEKYREQSQAEQKPKSRREELEALHPMKLGPVMRSMGLDHEGLSRAQKIEAILAAEAAKKTEPEPALAEY